MVRRRSTVRFRNGAPAQSVFRVARFKIQRLTKGLRHFSRDTSVVTHFSRVFRRASPPSQGAMSSTPLAPIRVWSPEPGTSSRTTWLPSGGEVPEASRQRPRLQLSLPGRGRTSLPGTTAARSDFTLSDAGGHRERSRIRLIVRGRRLDVDHVAAYPDQAILSPS